MAIYAVYLAESYIPVAVVTTKKETAEWAYTAYEIVRYNHLTQKQAQHLTYSAAKACEAILRENYAPTLQ